MVNQSNGSDAGPRWFVGGVQAPPANTGQGMCFPMGCGIPPGQDNYAYTVTVCIANSALPERGIANLQCRQRVAVYGALISVPDADTNGRTVFEISATELRLLPSEP